LRTSASPFLDEDTVKVLAGNKRPTLVIAGFATEVVVLQAALHAASAGYQVLVPIDACGGMSERTEMAALRHIEASGAILTSVVSLSTALAPDFTTDLGKQMFALVQQLRLAQ
jgi:nicotinamidase-related amidase